MLQGIDKGVSIHFKKRYRAVREDVAMHCFLYPAYNSQCLSCTNKTNSSGTHALMAIVRPLLLAFGIISSCFSVGALSLGRHTRMASSVPVSASALSDILRLADANRVTRFVCAHCTATGKLSSAVPVF